MALLSKAPRDARSTGSRLTFGAVWQGWSLWREARNGTVLVQTPKSWRRKERGHPPRTMAGVASRWPEPVKQALCAMGGSVKEGELTKPFETRSPVSPRCDIQCPTGLLFYVDLIVIMPGFSSLLGKESINLFLILQELTVKVFSRNIKLSKII